MHILKPLPGTLPMPGRPLADAIALWPMTSLGNKVFDLSGNGNTGTFGGDVTWGIGDYGLVLSYPGTNGVIDCGNKAVFDFTGPMTLVIRVKNTSSANNDFVGKWDGSDMCFLLMYSTNDDYRFMTGGSAANNTARATGYPEGSCHTIAGVFDGTNTKIYVDGIWKADAPTPLAPVSTAGTLRFGLRYDSSSDFKGNIDYVPLYNRDLFASEIALQYREPFCMFPEPIMPEFGIAA